MIANHTIEHTEIFNLIGKHYVMNFSDRCNKFECSSKPYSTCKVVDDKPVCACPEVCPKEVDLLCGSDCVTYSNECLMRQAACRSNSMITVRRKGHCGMYYIIQFAFEMLCFSH